MSLHDAAVVAHDAKGTRLVRKHHTCGKTLRNALVIHLRFERLQHERAHLGVHKLLLVHQFEKRRQIVGRRIVLDAGRRRVRVHHAAIDLARLESERLGLLVYGIHAACVNEHVGRHVVAFADHLEHEVLIAHLRACARALKRTGTTNDV